MTSSDRATWLKLGALLFLGFILRVALLSNEGFKNDIAAFESWALSLASMPFSAFYGKAGFADYPPGYFYVLGFLGRVYAAFHVNDPGWIVLRTVVKLPAVLMDLFDGALMFVLVRRFFGERWAFVSAALFVLNPAVIFISAAWGQVDSIAGGLALLSAYLLLTSDDDDDTGAVSWRIVGAWVSIGYALLVKPQPAIVIPLMIAFAFVDAQRRSRRLISTAAGIAAAFVLALALALPFHPTLNPVDAFAWLYRKYTFGSSVYPFNSINAFNIWTIRWKFWEPDGQPIAMFAQSAWGLILLAAASVLILVRYVQARTAAAFLESAALLSLAFFMLATRMHERYVFDGLLFTIAAVPVARRYLVAALIFTVTLSFNLWYSWQYILVMFNHTPGVDPRDLYPSLTHPLSLLNVATFFFLGFVFLGQSDEAAAASAAPQLIESAAPARTWFDPREGLARLVWPLDYVLCGAIGLFSFVLSFVNYWKPGEKIFDEIYFARAAEEYLTHKYIYESTHPPLTKLIITFSQMLFGGLQNGHATAAGSRFLDVVFGAVAVVVLYAFAKRLTRSTLFASIAALLLTFDGMHFVQSRIATPEGIVVVFSLGTLYAFYRYWLAAQSVLRRDETAARPLRVAVSAAAALLGGFALSALLNVPTHQTGQALAVAGLYFALGIYLLMRLVVMPRIFPPNGEYVSYPDGSFAVRSGDASVLHAVDGRTIDSRRRNAPLEYRDDESTLIYNRDCTVRYETPAGDATYAPALVETDGAVAQDGRHRGVWLVAFTVLLGMLVASKWYGVMAYPVSFLAIGFVWTQRYLRDGKPKLWGNPTGFRLDVAFVTILFLSLTVYGLVWIPDAVRHIYGEVQSFSDLVKRQYDMFHYHDTLVATHPYQSPWWQWPLDLRPIAYYFKDTTGVPFGSNPAKCCVAEILSLPNPLILWFGLFSVPFAGYLAWKERNKGYALLVLAYLLQWLPWMRSPRITFAYHFYVDIPIVVLCNVIVLQRLWNLEVPEGRRLAARAAVVAYVVAVGAAFAFFYPVLAGVPIAQGAWNARMWHALMGNYWI